MDGSWTSSSTTMARSYYISPVSGCKFQSKREVLHHLKVAYFDDPIYGDTSFAEQSMQSVIAQQQNSVEWLPPGWILEIKTRLSGEKVGQNYKCYYDPFTGSRFYSKAEVLRFLKSGKFYYTPTLEERERFKDSAKDDVVALIEYSPDGLPVGWTKETILRKSKDNNRIRRDPYYTDPVSGYVFRTIKDATRYIETKELGKYAFGPRKSISEIYCLGMESPSPIPVEELISFATTTRRCLFAEEAQPSNGAIVIEIDDSSEEQLPPSSPDKLQSPPPDHTPSKSSRKTGSTSSPYIDLTDIKANKKKREVSEAATDNSLDNSNHSKQKTKGGRPSKKTRKLTLHSEENGKKGDKEKELPKPEPTNKTTPDSQQRKHPRRIGKAVFLPRRSSKRLASLDPAPADKLVIRCPSRRQQPANHDEPLLADEPGNVEIAEEVTTKTFEDKAPSCALSSVNPDASAMAASD